MIILAAYLIVDEIAKRAFFIHPQHAGIEELIFFTACVCPGQKSGKEFYSRYPQLGERSVIMSAGDVGSNDQFKHTHAGKLDREVLGLMN